ncbi:Integrase catalytic domain-containing protein, partial [Aphis craccivora]
TSAHLTLKSKKIKKGSSKYKDIIHKLFLSGVRLSMKLQKNNLVYWDNPNELVDRLRLLLSSNAADCFTKFAWAVAIKSKTGKEVTNAMSKILIDRAPKLLQLDNGK